MAVRESGPVRKVLPEAACELEGWGGISQSLASRQAMRLIFWYNQLHDQPNESKYKILHSAPNLVRPVAGSCGGSGAAPAGHIFLYFLYNRLCPSGYYHNNLRIFIWQKVWKNYDVKYDPGGIFA